MKRKTYLILIWTFTLCAIVFSSIWRIARAEKFSFSANDFFSDSGDFFVRRDKSDARSSNDIFADLPEFSKIELDANIMSVKILEGENRTLECNFSRPQLKPEYKIENGVLTIRQKKTSRGNFGRQNCDLTIAIPKGEILERAKIKTNIGEIEICDVEIQNIFTRLNIGEIKILAAQFDVLNAKLNIGDFSVNVLRRLDDFSVDLKTNVGEIKVENNYSGRKFRKNGVSDKKIEASVNIGEIILN